VGRAVGGRAGGALGAGDEIVLPAQSDRVTAEGELALVIGREAKNVVSNDTFSLWSLVSFHSEVMTLLPIKCTN